MIIVDKILKESLIKEHKEKKEEIKKILSKFSREKILSKISEITIINAIEDKCIENIKIKPLSSESRKEYEINIGAWSYTDLAYETILNSKDYTEECPNEKELIELLVKINEIKELECQINSYKYCNEEKQIYLAYAYIQKQSLYQTKGALLIQFYRTYYMFTEMLEKTNLCQIAKTILEKNNCKICYNSIFIEETGYNIEQYFNSLLYIFSIAITKGNFNNIVFNDFRSLILNEKCIKDILERYTIDYAGIRNSEKKEYEILINPIIKTKKNKRIIINGFLIYKLLYDSLYWTVRKHFLNKKDNKFVNSFGYLFEIYVSNLLKEYEENIKYEYLDSEKTKEKISDWIIETEKYFIVVEQKSAIMPLDTKTYNPDIEKIKKFVEDNYNKKGVSQLNSTVELCKEKIKNRKVIKIILYYDLIFNEEIIHKIFSVQTKSSENNLFFVNINEFEILIELLAKNKEKFNKIMEIKINSKQNSKLFMNIFRENDIYESEYLKKIKTKYNTKLKSDIVKK